MRWRYCLWMMVAAACGNGATVGTGKPDSAATMVPRAAKTVSPNGGRASARSGEPETTQAAPAPSGKTRVSDGALPVWFDYLATLSAAVVRAGGILVDMGSPSRSKHTLGDWKSGWSGNAVWKGATVSWLTGNRGAVTAFLDADEAPACQVVVRAAGVAEGRTPVRIYVNGTEAGRGEVERGAFTHVSVSSEACVAGRNEIFVRADKAGRGPKDVRARLAVDYVRIIPSGVQGTGISSAAVLQTQVGQRTGVHLPQGVSLSWHVPAMDEAVLVGTVTQGAAVVSTMDGAGTWQEAAVWTPGGENRLPLSSQVMGVRIAGRDTDVTVGDLVLRAPPPRSGPAPGRPTATNAVLVLIDTLRADHLSVYNPQTPVRTPFFDKLARESALFAGVAQENWTKPSIATLLTGLYPAAHRTKKDTSVLPAAVPMISEHLRSLGFVTAGFVANGYISRKFGFRRGFDAWTNYVREGKRNRAQFVMQDAVRWLQQRDDKKPFFLYVHTIDPHVPYIPPRSYWQVYDPEPYRGVVSPADTANLLARIKTGAVRLSDRDKWHLHALYNGEISYHDDQFAALYDELAAQGLLEDTVVVVTADHGEEFFEHGSVGHGHSLYEELLRVPLLVRLPGARPGAAPWRWMHPAQLVDIVPTLCAVLGVACPSGVQGRSLVSRLEGTDTTWPQWAFSEFMDGQLSVRGDRYKLIVRGKRVTVFDLRDDPEETADRSGALPGVTTALWEALGTHMGAVAAGLARRGSRGVREEHTTIDAQTKQQLKALGYMVD